MKKSSRPRKYVGKCRIRPTRKNPVDPHKTYINDEVYYGEVKVKIIELLKTVAIVSVIGSKTPYIFEAEYNKLNYFSPTTPVFIETEQFQIKAKQAIITFIIYRPLNFKKTPLSEWKYIGVLEIDDTIYFKFKSPSNASYSFEKAFRLAKGVIEDRFKINISIIGFSFKNTETVELEKLLKKYPWFSV